MSASAPDLGEAVRTLKVPQAVALGRRSVATLTTPAAAIAIVIVAVCAGFAALGADSRWLAALGRVIVARHSVPSGVPFAAAPSAHFPNALVLAEILFYGLERTFGDRGLMLAQMLAVGIAMTVLARDGIAARGSNRGVAVALGIATLGALPSLAIIRVQLFSLALFPVLVMLLRSEARCPSSRIWLVVPLLALWSNLHAAVLIGFGVTACYLVLSRLRLQPVLAVLVGATAAVALCLTPALARTITYYHLGLTNVSVQRGYGLWAPLSLSRPFDVVLVVAAVVLALGLLRARPALWELVALVALSAATIKGSRDGIWLLFFLVAPGAHAFRLKRRWNRLAAPVVTVAIAAIALSIARGPSPSGASRTAVARAVQLAHGGAVLAPDINAEQVALAGGKIWLSNPLEAFSRHYQALYIDWLEGLPSGRGAVTSDVNVALVPHGSDTAKLMDGERNFVAAFSDGTMVLYVRKSATTSSTVPRLP